jgi:hypothetical protein
MPFNIKLDFTTFNSLLNSDQQAAVIRAAQDWEALLASNEFDDIPLGTKIRYVNPNTGNIETQPLTLQNGGPIDDVLIYVGDREIPPLTPGAFNIAKANLRGDNVPLDLNNPNIDNDYLSARMKGIKFQPSIGSISFNPNPAQIQFWTSSPSNTSPAANEYDLYTVAKHEIGHILGFYNNPDILVNSAFEQLQSGSSGNKIFNGKNAKSVSWRRILARSFSTWHYEHPCSSDNFTHWKYNNSFVCATISSWHRHSNTSWFFTISSR